MKKILNFLLLALLPWMGFAPAGKPAPAASADRALFFACNRYENLSPLNNPVPNAGEIAGMLKQRYGFETEILPNASLEQIENKLREYDLKYRNGTFDRKGQLLVFFSGHGAVENEIGFFLPTDADPKRLKYTALDYPYWRNFLDNLPVQHLFVAIDACYSVRFDAQWNTRPDGRFQRVGELSDREKLLQDHANTKTRIFFTSDGKGEETPDKSSFAKKFQEGLLSGGGTDGILTSTELYAYVEGARPRPHCSEFGDDRAESSFLFIGTNASLSDLEADAAAWDRAAQVGTADAYRVYLGDFPNGSFAALARQRIAALESEEAKQRDSSDWKQALDQGTPEGYETYLKDQPQGSFAALARQGLAAIEAEEAQQRDSSAWKQALDQGTPEGYETYLKDQPQGSFAALAQQRLAAIEAEETRQRDLSDWKQALDKGTLDGYRAYLKAQPQGRFRNTAMAASAEPERVTTPILPDRPRMVRIPGGSFDMGNNEGHETDKPLHRVQISTFELAEKELTNAQYCAFLNTRKPVAADLKKWINLAGKTINKKCRIQQKGSAYTVKPGYKTHPVIFVSWHGAVAYCEWLSVQTGQHYRLPTEAEWEYAAGGGSSNRTKWSGTSREGSLGEYAWFASNSGYKTHPVGQKKPNGLGLYDMSGNVWEWCEDEWYGNYFDAPSDGSARVNNTDGYARVLRGGSYFHVIGASEVTERGHAPQVGSDHHMGFRVAR